MMMHQKMIILRISKINEQKPEIKKIKKQDTEKKFIKLKNMLFIQNMELVK